MKRDNKATTKSLIVCSLLMVVVVLLCCVGVNGSMNQEEKIGATSFHSESFVWLSCG